ncbi:DUF6400 family protein [Planotetraspora sp. A-T 1434]|uniref:DUF6400 family protein n=1 Tax=Planotetraspora sp. A-T 1434 TaxID=2979219 RepID=UPI0021BF0939|nr:DUF6400 family protein [Planotetraspora sp. A-T 1434]MCT9934208.1 DUF6400 family protein [Planotetraspora sp. A-T 1434]
MHQESGGEHAVFEIDLALEEARRRAAVIAGIGPHWDPVAALRSEQEAYDLLYSDLDEHQRDTYAMLADAGVLPRRDLSHAAD